MIKFVLQKVYDSVEWIYLEQVMVELVIPGRYMEWIMECIRIVNYTVLINGEPSEPFDAAIGLRLCYLNGVLEMDMGWSKRGYYIQVSS